MSTVGLHDFVNVSISASLKSFLLNCFGHDRMRVCCRMCKETQTSKWNETCYESMKRQSVFIRSLGDEEHMGLVERVDAMMRATGR